ncbi:NAD-dependent epimerase/dehydratase family protein [Urechidicola vernalis]|uniref:NAD-dependent epimerase/dehydratase family protein n=1 Tax=Urechidicola vernalis TaxID=3075600 RepID=A0ABU2Y414_9FLAO|nr:NAD-dependent epimerase/dehydratase family protein [Urechidicola sp. P050]MDT0551995.1 NAD-dependent epimerase/dehydratase family protein [Urechidicola sp. P050]
MKRFFVTGANGFLGTNLCHDLLDKGYHVTGLVRDKNSFKGNLHKNLSLIEGQLFDDFAMLFKRMDVVIHVAATTDQSLLDYVTYWKINCNATKQIFNTAILSNVKRFIFVSTANTMGYGTLQELGTEQNNVNTLFKQSYYARSKLEAENYLLTKKHKIDTIIVNPTFMLGAFDSKPSSGRIILMGWKKHLVFYPPGGKNFVHVKDVTSGIINAIDKGISGEKYLLANKNMSYREFFKLLNTITNQNPIMIQIPKQLLLSLGYLGDLLRTLQLKSNLSLINTKILCIENYFSNNKSIEHLNMTYQPIEKAISDAIDYFSNSKKQL